MKVWRVCWTTYEISTLGHGHESKQREKFFSTEENARSFCDRLIDCYVVLGFDAPFGLVCVHEVNLY